MLCVVVGIIWLWLSVWCRAPEGGLPGAAVAVEAARCLFSHLASLSCLLWLLHHHIISTYEERKTRQDNTHTKKESNTSHPDRHGILRNISWENFGYPEVITEESILKFMLLFVAAVSFDDFPGQAIFFCLEQCIMLFWHSFFLCLSSNSCKYAMSIY